MKKTIIALLAGLSLMAVAGVQAGALPSDHWQTDQGMQVVFYPAPEVPMVEVRLAFRAGSAYDRTNFGLSSLTSSLIGDASKTGDANSIAEQFESVGALFFGNTGRDMQVFNLRTLTEPAAYKQAVRTFTDTIAGAKFLEGDFKREQQRLLNRIIQNKESPDTVASNLFYQKLYGTHPYAHPVAGTTEMVTAIRLEQVQDFYKRYYVAANAYLVIVGNLQRQQAEALADTLGTSLRKGEAAKPVPEASALKKTERVDEGFPASQTFLRVGQLGINYASGDFFPLLVGNYILGGSPLVSRLGEEVREKRGLTYGVVSRLQPLAGKGPFLIGLSTKTQQSKAALNLTESILRQFVTKGPEAEELAAAKKYLIGSFPLSLASNRQIADVLLRMAFYDLPQDYLRNYPGNIDSVTRQQIRDATRKLIDPDKLLVVKVGPK